MPIRRPATLSGAASRATGSSYRDYDLPLVHKYTTAEMSTYLANPGMGSGESHDGNACWSDCILITSVLVSNQ